MIKNHINIAEILENCPKGTKLYSPLCGECTLERITDESKKILISTPTSCGATLTFHNDGKYYQMDNAECLLFPSKDQRDWSKFVPPCKFKDGDVGACETKDGCVQLFLIKGCNTDGRIRTYCFLDINGDLDIDEYSYFIDRLATEEEKAKLFDAIKEKGYKWNEETKTLEKLVEHKFKYKDIISNISLSTIGYKWNKETKTLEKLSVPSTPEKFYIRIGDIPSEEKSSVYRGDVVIGYEDGVSVYDCIETDGLYRIVMPFPLKEGQGMTYECLIQEITQCRYEIENHRNVYLVSGIEVGKGNDNEPVIKNVKILKDLTEQFNTKNDNTEETKTLEKLIEPKFKVGDKIIKRDSILNPWIVSSVSSEYYGLKSPSPNDNECIGVMSIAEQDEYELVPNKFDVINFEPFMKVLVRSDNSDVWECDFFSLYNSKCSNRFHCIGAWYNMCIPYIGNEHLRGTTDDCDEFYKNWE